ncbi:MAG: XdhC family protein [Pseudomonadota bacterium]
MSPQPAHAHSVKAVLDACLRAPDEAVLAVIAHTEGPSYRPIGAMMALLADGDRVGALSSGCIEADLALHAADVVRTGRPAMVRYGLGSPYLDIQLPCGGALEVLLVPSPDPGVLSGIVERHGARHTSTLAVNVKTGAMSVEFSGETGRVGARLLVRIEPELRFLVFGKGPEASAFSSLVQSIGYPNLLLAPDEETLDHGRAAGCETRYMTAPVFPDDLAVDDRTAILLFFHDHDWEPPILEDALGMPAFYVGAQGSRRASETRLSELDALGIGKAAQARLKGPIGLIPSARDARTLAVSVLAEVLVAAMAKAE